MSGSTIGGVVGGVIGFYFGGPQGAQWGWMIGSAVGAYVDPDVIKGPRLSDARNQTSRDGVAMVFGWGTFPTAGNMIWVQPGEPTEHEHEDDGKGGPVQVTFTYTRSYAIGICEGPITGILQVKEDGKLVLDTRTDAVLLAEYQAAGMTTGQANERLKSQRAQNGKFLSNTTFYLGDETQLPDPTMEDWMGVGEVPAYRGLAYMVKTDADVTQSAGAVHQYEFVVSVCGDVETTPGDEVPTWLALPAAGGDPNNDTARLSPLGDAWPANSTFDVGDNFRFAQRHDRTILLIGQGSPGRYGYSANRGADWATGDLPITMDAASGRICWTKYGWFVSGGNGEHVLRGSGTSFTQPCVTDEAIVAQVCVASVNRLVGATIFGSPNKVSITEDGGVTWEWHETARASTLTQPKIASNEAGRIVLAGTNALQVQLQHSDSYGDEGTWVEHTSPFSAGGSGACTAIRFIPVTNTFVVASNDGQIAYGGGSGTWNLATHTMGAGVYVTGWGDDGAGRIVGSCSDGTTVYTDDPASGFTTVVPESQPSAMYDVEYIGLVGDPIPDAPGWYVDDNGVIYGPESDSIDPCVPTLAAIDAGLCQRSGLADEEYDVSQLTDLVPGFRIANEGDAVGGVAATMPAYFYDVGEWDGQVHFVKRGGEAVAALTPDDLVERDGDAFAVERIQEAELLRRVTVGYIDPAAAFGPTTQKWERRAGTVQARGEASRELPLTLTADDAATMAKRQGLIAWSEPEKYKFSLSMKHAYLTPTDVVTYTNADGETLSLRIMSIEDDSGVREIEASLNCTEAYTATATGVQPDPPTIPGTSTVGPTIATAMNLPTLRSADARPGVYVAACGVLPAWNGCVLYLSLDGGVRYTRVLDMPKGAIMGRLTTGIGTSGEPLQVSMLDGGTLSTATTDQLAAGYNTCAIGAEVLQFKTATPTTTTGYDLTDVTRALRYTTAATHSASDYFVLVNDAFYFLGIDPSHAGETLYFKAVAYGTSPDAATPFTLVYDPASYIIDGGGA